MSGFTLILQDSRQTARFDDVVSFVGEDRSGSFGIMANHARTMSVLVIGLSRFRIGEGEWQYLATPGALLYFYNNQLTISTRHYLIDNDYMRISKALTEKLLEEESQLQLQKKSLRQMEETVLKRLWELGQNMP